MNLLNMFDNSFNDNGFISHNAKIISSNSFSFYLKNYSIVAGKFTGDAEGNEFARLIIAFSSIFPETTIVFPESK